LYLLKLFFRVVVLVAVFSSSIAVHECGHYVFVRAAGIPVEEVCIGEGSVVAEGRLPDGAIIRLRAIPFSGFVRPDERYQREHPPSTVLSIGMFGAGIATTTVLSCLLFIVFGALTGITTGFWRAVWFGIRRTFVALLLFPWLLIYGLLTLRSPLILLNNPHFIILKSFLFGRSVQCQSNRSEVKIVSPWPLMWLGMLAVMMLVCSLIGLIPQSVYSDPTMVIVFALSWFESVLPFSPFDVVEIWATFITVLIIMFLVQSLILLVIAPLRGRTVKEGESDDEEDRQ
jgi:hypothetical protein